MWRQREPLGCADPMARRGQRVASTRQGQLGMEWDKQAARTGLWSLEMNSAAGRDSGKTRRHCIKMPQTSFPHLLYLYKHQSQVSSCAQQLTHLYRAGSAFPVSYPSTPEAYISLWHIISMWQIYCGACFKTLFLLLICQSSKLKFS